MFKQLFFLGVIIFSWSAVSAETIKVKTNFSTISKDQEIELKVYALEHKLKTIAQSQLNYKIEKDLLKETYSNNYDRINIFIAIVLSIFGLIGYSGIRSINTIKKEYITELAELKSTKTTFEQKAIELDKESKKINLDLKTIFEENQNQNNQIKFLELKSKIKNLIKENNIILALEFLNAALKINPHDISCLSEKANIMIMLGKIEDSNKIHMKCYEENPEDINVAFNYVESLYFSGNIKLAKEIINKHKNEFEKKCDGKLLPFLEIIEHYHNKEIDKLKEKAKSYVTLENIKETQNFMNKKWSLKEAHYFTHALEKSELQNALKQIILYWDRKINGKGLLTSLKIDLPTTNSALNQQKNK
jgi:hypothetical protein